MSRKSSDNQITIHQVRDNRLDAVKYWLIILVIIGHVFGRSQFADIPACTIVWKWIYIFHMPLFIFISGYLSKKKDKGAFLAGIWKLAEPLIICHLITIAVKFFVKGSVPLSTLLTPPFALWYLLSLIYWRTLLQVIPNKYLNNPRLILSVAFCISILAGFLPIGRLLSVQRALSFMWFFFLGYYMKGKSLFLPDKYRPMSFVFLALTLIVPVFYQNCLGYIEHADPYKAPHDMLNSLLVFVLSIPMSLAFINLVPNTLWAAQQGRFTMQYYIYHALIILPWMSLLSRLNFPMTFLSASIYSAIMIIGLGIASKLPYFSVLTNPSSMCKRKSL